MVTPQHDDSEHDEDEDLEVGKFPDEKARQREIFRRRLKRIWASNKKGVIVAGAILVLLIGLALFAMHSAITATKEGAAQLRSVPLNLANRDTGGDPPPPGSVPLPTAANPCLQNPALCQTGQPQQQSHVETARERMAKKMEQFNWDSRFRAPDEGQGSKSVATPPVPSEREDEAPAEAAGSTPPPSNPPSDGVRRAEYSKSDGDMYLIFGGVTQISARLQNQITGELSGPVVAITNEPVYSWHQEAVLIPKGTFLIGNYEKVQDQDQERVQITLDSMIMPDGYRVYFPKAETLDQSGQAGLSGDVNHHYLQIFATAIAISGIGASAQVGGGYESTPVGLLRVGFGQGASQAANRVLERYAYRRPTITIPSGKLINLFVPVDMPMPDYKNHRMNPHI